MDTGNHEPIDTPALLEPLLDLLHGSLSTVDRIHNFIDSFVPRRVLDQGAESQNVEGLMIDNENPPSGLQSCHLGCFLIKVLGDRGVAHKSLVDICIQIISITQFLSNAT